MTFTWPFAFAQCGLGAWAWAQTDARLRATSSLQHLAQGRDRQLCLCLCLFASFWVPRGTHMVSAHTFMPLPAWHLVLLLFHVARPSIRSWCAIQVRNKRARLHIVHHRVLGAFIVPEISRNQHPEPRPKTRQPGGFIVRRMCST